MYVDPKYFSDEYGQKFVFAPHLEYLKTVNGNVIFEKFTLQLLDILLILVEKV